MYHKTLKVNNIATEIISCNPWTDNEIIEDEKQDIIVIITGNPGIPAYYEEFAISLQNSLLRELPLWIIGHTGHTKPPDNAFNYYPNTQTEAHLYDLKGNLDHKVN
jgi:hypothetical protein